MFKPKIHLCEYTEDGETFEFNVREASGLEVLRYDSEKLEKFKKTERNVEATRELFAKYVVNADGTPISPELVQEMLESNVGAMQAMAEIVADKARLRSAANKDAAKKD